MKNIMEWVMATDARKEWIMWLQGTAGAGKSAISQSIAELCAQLGIPIASFFFFRTDPTRNNIRPLVATLAYQLARIVPPAREIITQAIDNDPLVFEQSVEHQLDLLVLGPLRQLGQLSGSKLHEHPSPMLIVIDGLDECDDRRAQSDLVRVLATISSKNDAPVLFLIASRPEPHLTMAFRSKNIANILNWLPLDHKYLPENDILIFLNDKFAEIKDTHPLNHTLDPTWPPISLVKSIVAKSSGQFIYAAVVINYVASARGHPGQRLEVCCGLRPANSDSPFAQLDTLYCHILSNVQDKLAAQRALALSLYDTRNIRTINSIFGYARGTVESWLADLTAVISCDKEVVNYLHASFGDFLCDPARSGEYFIDGSMWCAEFAVKRFQCKLNNYMGEYSAFAAIRDC